MFEKPIRDVLQRWRISLASLLFFITMVTETSGITLKLSTPRILEEVFSIQPTNHVYSRHQCLSLRREYDLCDLTLDVRQEQMRNLHLKFCDLYPLYSIVNSRTRECIVNGTPKECRQCLRELEQLDADVDSMFCGFDDLIDRYDCAQPFASKWTCADCAESYKNWLCAMHVPYYVGDEKVLPCVEFCVNVEEICPFFRPQILVTHAGDPSFICKDPDIVSRDVLLYGEEPSCYKLCHLRMPHTMDEHVACHSLENSFKNHSSITRTESLNNGAQVSSRAPSRHRGVLSQNALSFSMLLSICCLVYIRIGVSNSISAVRL